MANSKYEYVKKFERSDILLPSTYIVIRLDGRGFHRLSKMYDFKRPNDRCALELMNSAAVAVMENIPDIAIAYGVSDEFSFVFYRDTSLFERRESKLVSTVVSTFTAHYVLNWPRFLPEMDPKLPIPTFDARAVIYPNPEILKDYMRWRQVDCHINNLYNTTFWALVQEGGLANDAAEQKLKGTLSGDKNEILFSQFGINYNDEREMFKKGSVIYRGPEDDAEIIVSSEATDPPTEKKLSRNKRRAMQRSRRKIITAHIDIIKEDFWEKQEWILA